MKHKSPVAPEGILLWEPSEERMNGANLTRYIRWLKEKCNRDFGSYDKLWEWSTGDLEGFWSSVWDYFKVSSHKPYRRVLATHEMPGTRWFDGAELNYAEYALRRQDDHAALLSLREGGTLVTMTYAELYRQTAAAAGGLKRLGVKRGDRVAAFLPNTPETLIAFLAAASMGAIWSGCSPDFGAQGVVSRFRQIEPRVFFATDGYRYHGRSFDRMETAAAIHSQLPSLKATVIVPAREKSEAPKVIPGAVLWNDFLGGERRISFEAVPFEHPLWIVYSSGTTGLPKPIVHGHGGILLEHLKELSLHLDLSANDRFFWFTTTGWMMWNFLASGLLLGSTLVLYDGSPAYPDMNCLWEFADRIGITYFGTSAPYLQSCIKSGLEPGRRFDLKALCSIGSTGSPLAPGDFGWIYRKVKADLLVGSVSGGTDLCTAFVGSCPLLPVNAGEIQCRQLGAAVEAYDPLGKPLVGEVGELVLTEPMPSMPLFFWNDPGDRRYRESYFSMFPGKWRHGDWIKITPRGSCVIYGRSDATINRAGVRMGTSEFYRVLETIPEITDSLIVDTGHLGKEGRLFLFVVLRRDAELDEDMIARIRKILRSELSPRHIPDEIHRIEEVPRTLSGKKVEVPVKRILSGLPPEQVASSDALANPEGIRFFFDLAAQLRKRRES